jgi:hypothetical protein
MVLGVPHIISDSKRPKSYGVCFTCAYQVVPGGRSVGTWQVKTDAPPAPAVKLQVAARNQEQPSRQQQVVMRKLLGSCAACSSTGAAAHACIKARIAAANLRVPLGVTFAGGLQASVAHSAC